MKKDYYNGKNQHNAGLHYRPLNQLGLSNFNDHIENPIDSRFKFNPPPLKCGKLFGLRKVDRQKEELQKHCPWHPLLKMKAFTLEIDGEAEYIPFTGVRMSSKPTAHA